ncbi:MAG: hydrogenase maturation nickel metallochaperone HypA [Methylocystaceae bacterium]
MHEMSLVEGIMNTVRISAVANGIQRVGRIKLIIGKLSMALPESLDFVFSCLLQQEPLFADATLDIEEKEVVGKCRICSSEFRISESDYQCPDCQVSAIDLISGRELYIEFYEGEAQ